MNIHKHKPTYCNCVFKNLLKLLVELYIILKGFKKAACATFRSIPQLCTKWAKLLITQADFDSHFGQRLTEAHESYDIAFFP